MSANANDVIPAASPNPLGVAGATEDQFQSLYDRGAFNADGVPDNAPAAPPAAASPRAESSGAPAAPTVADPGAAPAGAAEESPDFESLEDYLAKSNVEAASFYELPVSVRGADGTASQVKLSDLVNQYQFSAANTQRAQAIAENQRAFEAERQAAQQQLSQQLSQAQNLGHLARQQLLGEYQSIDWNKLRAEDPVRWSVMNTEFNQRANLIDQHLSQIQQAQSQAQAEAQAQFQRSLPAEREKLMQARPEWRDEKQFQAARTQISDFARKLGFKDAELQNIYDHRYMLVLDMASRYAQLQAASPQAVKRVRTAPISAQPGARTQRDPQTVARTQAKEAFQKNPRDQDAAARYFGTLS